MAHSIVTYSNPGSTGPFAVNFTLGFLDRSHVTAYVQGEVDGFGAQLYRTLTWINDGLASVSGAAITGTLIISRDTPMTSLVHNYQDGAVLGEANLDQSNLQHLMLEQEMQDGKRDYAWLGDMDATGHKLTNLGAPVLPGDAVPLSFLTDDLPMLTQGATESAGIAIAKAAEAASSAATVNNGQVNAEAYATLALAATDPSAAGKTVVVTSPQVVTTAIAWPADRDLRFEKGGYITFTGSGALTGLKEARPEDFGNNTTPGTTDMTTAFTKAIAAVKDNSGVIQLSTTSYRITSNVYFDGVALHGLDGYASQIHVSGAITALTFTGSRKKISNFSVWFDDYTSSVAPTTAVGIQFGANTYATGADQFSNNIVEHVYVRYAGRSFTANAAGTSGTLWNNTFINCRSDWAAEYGWYFNSIVGSTTQTWINCMVDGVNVDGSLGWSATSAGWYTHNIDDVAWINCQSDDMQNGNAIYINQASIARIDNFRSEGSQLTTNGAKLIYANAALTANNIKVQAFDCNVGAGNTGAVITLGSNGRGIIGDIFYQAVKITSGTFYKVNSSGLQFGSGHVNIASANTQRAEVKADDVGDRTIFSGKSLRMGITGVAPLAGTFENGDQFRQSLSTNNSTIDRFCSIAGTVGTLNSGATTATTTAASTVISVNSTTGLYQGTFITIAGVTGVKRVVSVVSATEVYIDVAANASVAGAAVAYSAPTFLVSAGAPVVGSATYDPPSIAAGAVATTTVAVNGAVLGDVSMASFSLDLAGLLISSYVSATNVVTVKLYNPTVGAIDLASGTLRAKVIDQ